MKFTSIVEGRTRLMGAAPYVREELALSIDAS